MDLLSMLMNARVQDLDGIEVSEVISVHLTGGKLYITIDVEGEHEDPDDGAKDKIPEDDASNTVTSLHAVGALEGTNG